MKRWNRRWLSIASCAVLSATSALSETCITQSQMQPMDRDTLANTAQALATKVQANDQSGLQSATIPEFAANFSDIGNVAATAAPKLVGATPTVDQIYVLDATANKSNPDGSAPDAEFVCLLNKGNSGSRFQH